MTKCKKASRITAMLFLLYGRSCPFVPQKWFLILHQNSQQWNSCKSPNGLPIWRHIWPLGRNNHSFSLNIIIINASDRKIQWIHPSGCRSPLSQHNNFSLLLTFFTRINWILTCFQPNDSTKKCGLIQAVTYTEKLKQRMPR